MQRFLSLAMVALLVLAGLSCVLSPSRWPRRAPPGKAGEPVCFFHRAIGSFLVAGAMIPGWSLLAADSGSDICVARGVLMASAVILLQMAYDLFLNPRLPESLAYPSGKGKLPVSPAHKVFVGLTVKVVLLSAAAVTGRLAGNTCLKAWIAYTVLRGLVLSSVNTLEKTRSMVVDAMFPSFEDAGDGSGLASLAWAVPALGKVFLCLGLQACSALATGNSPIWSSSVFACAVVLWLR